MAVLVLMAFYLHDPDGPASLLMTAATGVCMIVLGVGPLVRGARPWRVWGIVPLAGAFLFATVFQDWIEWRAGPFEYSDVMFLIGYVILGLWLLVLGRQVSEGPRDQVIGLDTAAACVGVALAVWTGLLAPLEAGTTLVTGIIWALYPPLDVALIALAIHLAFRLGRVPPPLRWLLFGVSLWLVTDTAYAVVELQYTEAVDIPVLECLYLVAHVSLAAALVHPRVEELLPAARPSWSRRSTGGRSAVVLLVFVPALCAAAVPEVSVTDYAVRTLLLATLLGLLFVRISRTVSALSAAEAVSRDRATHDPLTGLLNRAALFEAVDARLVEDARAGRCTVLLFLDCDDFKFVNDTWGHHAGDTLLVDVARRLESAAGPGDLVARHGGDEFIMVSSSDDVEAGAALARRVRALFDRPLRVSETRSHPLTPSLGVSVVAPGEAHQAAELISRADTAMYMGKAQGPGRWVLFDEQLSRDVHARRVLGECLSDGLDADRFDIALQPVMGGPGYGRVVGWEALARWEDVVGGLIGPEEFVPVAQELGLMEQLGESILRHACLRLAELHAGGTEADTWVSVDVTPGQLLDPRFPDLVRDATGAAGLPPSFLHVEIDEAILASHTAEVTAALRALREMGVGVYVDAFGTGCASLRPLLSGDIDGVKLHPSLTDGLGVEDDARRQIRAILGLLADLGVRDVIAQGVDRPEAALALYELGCPRIQGWPADGVGVPAPMPDTAADRRATEQAT